MKNSGLILVSLFVLLFSSGLAETGSTTAKRPAKSSSHSKAAANKSRKPGTSKSKKKKSKAVVARHVQRLHRAFVASADLKPMARQLLDDRTRPAYAGVEAYARKHANTDAGALAWLAVGYAHVLDHEYAKAIAPLQRAQPRAGDLGDYVAYFLAVSYSNGGQNDAVVATLRDFADKYPDSLFLRDAMHMYGVSLLASGHPVEAARVLEKYRNPGRADFEFALGRAYERAGDFANAAVAYKRAYYAYPLAPEAADARVALDRLTAQASVPSATFAERKSRADLLAQAHHNADAAREYRTLLSEAQATDRTALQVALGVALHRSGNDGEARPLLESAAETADAANALRLFSLAEIARAADDPAGLEGTIDRMRHTATTSEYLDQALLLAANMHLLSKDYDRAIDYYRELQQRFPAGRRASYAHWKATWLSLRQGRKEQAEKDCEDQVAWYSNSPETPAALYWRARLAEQDHDFAKARAWYAKLASRFQNYYYSDLARARLAALPVTVAAPSDPVLDVIPAPAAPLAAAATGPPSDDVRVQKALLLQNGGMTDFAVKELRAAADGGAPWASIEMARLYRDSGRYDRALQTLKRAVPTYYALEIPALPRPYWETLFPRPYWLDLKRYSAQNALDPFLVASLIRQESEFNPGAVSRADALGLMQLLPSTGKKVARELKVHSFSSQQLLRPNLNMQLGTRYFRNLMDSFGGRLEYALAAYNAGSDRVQTWLADGHYRDTEEFVESIPFTETREYVQAIMRNAAIYKRLYGTP